MGQGSIVPMRVGSLFGFRVLTRRSRRSLTNRPSLLHMQDAHQSAHQGGESLMTWRKLIIFSTFFFITRSGKAAVTCKELNGEP